MTSDEEQTSKPTRRSAPKVRTGCITCKVRHIKCDETKPACNRCVFTGRKCEGYEAPKRKDSITSDSTSPRPDRFPLARIPGSPAERRALYFFFARTAQNIAGFFEPSFWTRCVILLAQTEPPIRYAVQALGATYALMTERDNNSLLNVDDFALKAYNKAIRALVNAKQTSRGRKKITLVTCVLFVCLEFMRGEMEAAVKHIHGGLKLISEWKPAQTTINNGDSSSNSSTSHSSSEISDSDIYDDLKAMFSRLHLQAKFSMHSRPTPCGDPSIADTLETDAVATFSTLHEARDKLFSIASESVAVILPIIEAKYAKRLQFDMIVQQRHLETHLRLWRRNFESSIAIKKAMATTHAAVMGNMLMVYAISVYVWVCTCLEVSELVFDKYRDEYESIIALTRGILEAGAGCEVVAGAGFQFELGIVAPLHMIGSKCRYPELRQQILDVLTSARWREGLFDSHATARYIDLTRRVENEDVDPTTGLPTERARVHFADQGRFVGRPQSEEFEKKVVLFMKPEGPYGPWQIREETLDETVWGVFPMIRSGMVKRDIFNPILTAMSSQIRLTGQRIRGPGIDVVAER